MHQFLRPVDPATPRPLALSHTVVARGVQGGADAIRDWCAGRLVLDREAQMFAVSASIIRGGLDGFRAGVSLHDNFRWPVDIDMVWVIQQIIDRLPSTLKVETGLWVLKTGLRFPAEVRDLIEWIDEAGRRCAGEVHAVEKAFATALVQRVHDGQAERVFAEQVTANTSKGWYEEIKPVLGATYEDAPALGAAWEAAQPKGLNKPTVRVEVSGEPDHITITSDHDTDFPPGAA